MKYRRDIEDVKDFLLAKQPTVDRNDEVYLKSYELQWMMNRLGKVIENNEDTPPAIIDNFKWHGQVDNDTTYAKAGDNLPVNGAEFAAAATRLGGDLG